MRRTGTTSSTFLLLLVGLAASPLAGQAPHRLTLEEAIKRGLETNLKVLLAGTERQEAKGTHQRRRAALLPQLRNETSLTLQTRNLRAFGIDIPNAPGLIGPFSTYSARLAADQPLLDLPSYHRWKASRWREEAAGQDYQDVRDLIIRQVADLYLNAQAAQARAEAAASRVTTAEELRRLAHAQREAGVATGVDVLRAKVEWANENQRWLEARNLAEQARLALARAIGLELRVPFELAEPLTFKPVPLPELASAVDSALANRADYRALQVRHHALLEEAKANRARRLPRLSMAGVYDAIGRTPGQIRGTWSVQAVLGVELFSWDRHGEQLEIDSRRRRLEHQSADLRVGIEQEIREALLGLESATAEVGVAEEGRRLAEQELELVRERFQAGVTTNIEVTAAQESLARAQENQILALSRHGEAKMALARALGATEEIYRHYLGLP